MTTTAPSVTAPARLLAGIEADGRPLALARHVRVHGALPEAGRGRGRRSEEPPLVAEVAASGLTGRGGGGFPVAAKMRAVRAASGRGRRPVVVVNGAESEPASRKDAVLLGRAPHLVLDGALLAAESVGAREVVVWVHRGPGVLRDVVEHALVERRRQGLVRVPHRVVAGPPRYVGGEASAIARHLSGGEARPQTTPPRVAERGVDGRPTMVSNAESLAHLALVARHGAHWFRRAGTPDEPGSQLLTVFGAVRSPGVVEVAVGTGVGALVQAVGGLTARPCAVLLGGYAGGWLTPEEAWPLEYSRAGLREVGILPGVGLVGVLPEDRCPVLETIRVVRWLAGESAGQCGPCLHGLPALAGALELLGATARSARATAVPGRLLRWAGMVEGRGACHHPDGVALLVRSLLRSFPDDVAAHADGEPCQPARALPYLPYLPLPDTFHGGEAWR